MLRGTLVFFVRAAHAVLDVVIDDEVQLLIREAVTAARGRWLTPSTVTASPSMSNAARHAPLRYLEHVASQDQLAGIQQSTDIGIMISRSWSVGRSNPNDFNASLGTSSGRRP